MEEKTRISSKKKTYILLQILFF